MNLVLLSLVVLVAASIMMLKSEGQRDERTNYVWTLLDLRPVESAAAKNYDFAENDCIQALRVMSRRITQRHE